MQEVHHQVQRAVSGDVSAAAWLYDSFAPILFRRLRQRYCYPGGPEAEDLLQDAFVFFYQNEGKVLRDYLARVPRESQTPRTLERHLWDLACGVATNRRRSEARRKVVPLTDTIEPQPQPSFEQGALDRDTLVRLDSCLSKQNERLYLYYKLRYRDGFSPAEIVEMTGWSRKATYKLKQSLTEAVRSCAEQLGLEV